MSWRYSSCLSLSSPNIRWSSTSENPMMALSGVRSSWDMLARNSDLCWFATSSCRLFSSISRNRRAFCDGHLRLVGERLHEAHDALAELARGAPDHHDAARHVVAPAHRHGQHRRGAPPGGRWSGTDSSWASSTSGICTGSPVSVAWLIVPWSTPTDMPSTASTNSEESPWLTTTSKACRPGRSSKIPQPSAPESAMARRATVSSTSWRSSEELDRADDLAERPGLLERLRQVLGARLQLLEQAHVLDRDHRLVREGLQQRDLLVGERPHLAAGGCTITPIGDALPEQRGGQHRPVARWPAVVAGCPGTPDPSPRQGRRRAPCAARSRPGRSRSPG